MHTFFINTSKKDLTGYEVLFDIPVENKTLVTMNCQMADWYDKEKGYAVCIRQMSDMIDGYVELNNSFNLLIYIDLAENKAYSSIRRDSFHDKQREECCHAMRILYTHTVSESIVSELMNSGRKPQNVLIMFGEDKKFTTFTVADNNANRQAVTKQVMGFLGLPDEETVTELAKAVHKAGAADKVAAFQEALQSVCGEELVPGIRESYQPELQLWYDEVIHAANVPKANEALFDRIDGINRQEADWKDVQTVSCPYDCYACTVNKSALALSRLNIALYVLRCVEQNSVFEKELVDHQQKVLGFHSYTLEELAPLFKAKERCYSEKISEIDTMEKSYSELKLAPQLRAFNHDLFGLDMYGDIATELVIQDVAPKEENKPEDAQSDEEQPEEVIAIVGNSKEVAVVNKGGRVMFTREEFPQFDYAYDYNGEKMLKKNAKPEEYIEQAKQVRRHHLDYLKKMRIHISEVLSNYASKSKENKPALLQVGGYRYASAGMEDKALESVETVSDRAYESIINQYMEFCAGRSIAVTDIEEQCNWFVSRIYQIKESLQKIKAVALGLLVAMIVLYLPFVVIQFEGIVENALTVAFALCSIAVPLALLYLIFAAVSARQRRKYIQVWQEFKEKSDLAQEANTVAARKYDQLLSVVVPSLRWVYEYKLDVDYCADCCKVADGKIEHHRGKLRSRIAAIRNILGDLEYREPEQEELGPDPAVQTEEIDYSVSFCSGKKNKRFYSLIDSELLDSEKM